MARIGGSKVLKPSVDRLPGSAVTPGVKRRFTRVVDACRLDGSLFAERAIASACRSRPVAAGLGAPAHLWSATRSSEDIDDRRTRILVVPPVAPSPPDPH